MRRILLFTLLAAVAWGQDALFQDLSFANVYAVSKETALSGTAEAVTVQQPVTNSGGQVVYFDGAAVYCSVDCVVTIERTGAAATATAMTPVALNVGVPAAKAQAFHGSNVGTAAATIGVYRIAAGGEKTIDLRGIRLRAGTRENLTVRTNAITGTARILVKWAEARP